MYIVPEQRTVSCKAHPCEPVDPTCEKRQEPIDEKPDPNCEKPEDPTDEKPTIRKKGNPIHENRIQ
jgi:hypothetical protein